MSTTNAIASQCFTGASAGWPTPGVAAGGHRHGDGEDVVGEQRHAGDLCREEPKLSRVTMYAPPADG